MKTLLITTALVLFSTIASAQCFDSGGYVTCTDGNSYNVQRYGNSTDVRGYNSNTGHQWDQHTDTIGNTTFERGHDAEGRSWNRTINQVGDYQFSSGSDSDGNYSTQICGPYGCN